MSDTGRLRIALPGLSDAVRRAASQGDVLRLPAAEWLLGRGHRVAADDQWREWLLAGAGLRVDVLATFAAGPCAAAAGRQTVPAGVWACAEPVHLLTGLDHLQLAAPAPVDLDAQEARHLLDTLNAHLEGSGFRLEQRATHGWLCTCPPALDCAALEPWQAVGRNLRDCLPTGRDAVRVRALVNELQMLLHEHPVNERRAAHGRPVVNSVWLWGFGAAAVPSGRASGRLLTDDDWLAGLWQLHGGRLEPCGELIALLQEPTGPLRVALTPAGTLQGGVEVLRHLERTVFAPVRDALAAGRWLSVALHVGTAVFEVSAHARWRFWRRARPLHEALA